MQFTRPTTKSELLSDLTAIDEYYKPQLSEFTVPTYTQASFVRKTFAPKSDDSLLKVAAAYAEKQAEVLKIEYVIPYQAKISANRAEKAAIQGKKAARMTAIDNECQNAVDAVDVDLGKKGIASSTISAGVKAKITEKYSAQKLVEGANYDALISKYDAEYAELNKIIDNADALFAKKQQVICDERLEELKKERDLKTKETMEYNNSMTDREITVNNTWKESATRLQISIANSVTSGYSGEKLEALGFYDDKKAVIQSYYSAMSPSDAYLDFSQTTEFVRHLGPHYYNVLYQMYRLSRS